MADKNIAELPELAAVTDDTLIPVWQPGAADEAQSMTGRQFREFAENCVTPYSAAAKADAIVAENAKNAAQSALSGVQTAIQNIPAGETPIVNDLTTGGATMALSAEMGKKLASEKLSISGGTMTGYLKSTLGGSTGGATFAGNNLAAYVEALSDMADGARRQLIVLNPESSADNIAVRMYNEKTNKTEVFYHTGNRPTATDVGAVSKAGDTMTGHLEHLDANSGRTARTAYSSTGYATLINRLDSANYNGIRIFPETEALARALVFAHSIVSVISKEYAIFGEHNKPSGSYTGNSSAVTRTVNIGGIGTLLMVRNGKFMTLVYDQGAVVFDFSGKTMSFFQATEAKFADGVLTLTTNSGYLNSGTTYYYQVL